MSEFSLPPNSSRFLEWLLGDSGEAGLGDFQEYYAQIAAEEGSAAAIRKFRRQVFVMTPGRLAEKARQSFIMLANYVTLAARHFQKQRLASTINVFGLSIAVACCITVFLFLEGYLNMNAEHVNGERTYLIEQVVERNGSEEVYGYSPMPLGPALVEDLASVQQSVRVSGEGAVVYVDDAPFETWVMMVEPGFLDLFTFPMTSGSSDALLGQDRVVLSHREAARLYGNESALGRQLGIVLGNGRTISATVSGVAQPFATSAGLRFSMLMDLDRMAAHEYADWTADAGATFIMLRPGATRDQVESALGRYAQIHNAGDPDYPVQAFRLDNIQDPNPRAWEVRDRIIDAPHPVLVLMLLAIPVFLLALSCFNYINISLGAAGKRLREIGVRKVVGASRAQLVLQFLGENLFLCFLSLLVGVVLSFFLLTPLFNSIMVNQIVFEGSDVWSLILFLLALLLLVGLISGCYPAFYVTSFRPVQVLRRRVRLGRKSWLTHGLLTAQFSMAFLTVILSVYLALNGQYMLNQEWGYDPTGVVSVRVSAPDEAVAVHDLVTRRAQVVSVARSVHQIGVAPGRARVTVKGEESEAWTFAVGANYLNTMGLALSSGRGFGVEFGGDARNSVVVNQAFVRQYAWDDPLAEAVRIDGIERNVVGVVDDFLLHPLQSDIPVLFTRSDDTEARFIAFRVSGTSPREITQQLRADWKRQFPDRPFDATIQSEVFDAHIQSYGSVVRAFSYLSALALIIACLGLFGLASQNIARQLKEVSIRKVLGASVGHILAIVNRRFLWMLIVAGAISTLITIAAFSALTRLPASEIRHLPLEPGLFFGAYALVFATAALAVGSQARLLLRADPASVLRRE